MAGTEVYPLGHNIVYAAVNRSHDSLDAGHNEKSRVHLNRRRFTHCAAITSRLTVYNMAITHSLARNVTLNAVLGWVFIGIVVVTALMSLLIEGLLGGVLAVIAAAILVIPAVVRRDWRVMVPWPLGLAVAVGVTARTLRVVPEVSGYVAISSVALAVVVELDAFTDIEMSRRFAVLSAVMMTVAFQSWWTIAGYQSDQWFGTSFILSQAELQWDLVAVMLVSLVMGGLFLWYFDRIEHVGSRTQPIVPEESS